MNIYEYVWLDVNKNFRSKARVCNSETIAIPQGSLCIPQGPLCIPQGPLRIPQGPLRIPWTYDGSSTGQATTESSEILLFPQKIIKNPFMDGHIILCSTSYTGDTIKKTQEIFDCTSDKLPMFGFEQEFFAIDVNTDCVIGYENRDNHIKKQFDYYCGVGAKNITINRQFMIDVLNNCIYSGLNVNGYNYEVAVGQAEFQVTGIGIDACHQLMLLRYILERTGEKYGYVISYDCKLLGEEWNGSGLHTNFSDINMRNNPQNVDYAYDLIEKLGKNHISSMESYGENNHKRLTGIHETSSYNNFTYGIGNRGASIRIPIPKNENGYSDVTTIEYFEDRRPASDADPYLVAGSMLFLLYEKNEK